MLTSIGRHGVAGRATASVLAIAIALIAIEATGQTATPQTIESPAHVSGAPAGDSATNEAAVEPAASAGPSVVPEDCTTERLQGAAPSDTTVSFAARESNSCRVSGYVTTNDPGPNRVLFMLILPDNFNGRYLYLGVGGAAGQLPVANPALLREGYVMAGSDAGTGPRHGGDFNFNPVQAVDYEWRGVHVSAIATQQIARHYYQRENMYRYISGCSAGGQMGITNAARFGRGDFDGFLVGAALLPGPQLYLPYKFAIAQRLQSNPDSWIEPEKLTRLQAAILARYDGLDGVEDGIIADPRDIPNIDDAMLRELGFTSAQIEMLRFIYAPPPFPRTPSTPAGRPPAFPLTSIGGWANSLTGVRPPPWPNTTDVPPAEIARSGAPPLHLSTDSRTRMIDPGLDYSTVSRPADIVRTANAISDANSSPSEFSALRQQGGRMIVWHGANDASIPVSATTDRYALIRARFSDADTWIRAYSVPGLQHCRGGEGPTDIDLTLLSALAEWVENGVAPEGVAAHRQTPARGVEREFLVCSEPRRPRLRAPGLDPMRAENWECRASDSRR